jgi:hypothetical protein
MPIDEIIFMDGSLMIFETVFHLRPSPTIQGQTKICYGISSSCVGIQIPKTEYQLVKSIISYTVGSDRFPGVKSS